MHIYEMQKNSTDEPRDYDTENRLVDPMQEEGGGTN